MARLQITCIKKSDDGDETETGIQEFQGIDENGGHWTRSRLTATGYFIAGTDTYFLNHNGEEIEVVGVSKGKDSYLRSERNKTPTDNLLKLQKCPETK